MEIKNIINYIKLKNFNKNYSVLDKNNEKDL